MEWKTFSREIKERGHMIFWDKKQENWFPAELMDDSEHGLIMTDFQNYWNDLDNISHYMIPEKPLKQQI